jgi:phage terminase small subunit
MAVKAVDKFTNESLTRKQSRLVKALMKGKNKKEAAIEAGYLLLLRHPTPSRLWMGVG